MRVFISYSRKQQERIEFVAKHIESLGHEVWFDQDLAGGQRWWDEILRQIRECDLFVFAISPDSIDSRACRREGRYAHQLGKGILPVVASRVSEKLLPDYLAAAHHVDYSSQNSAASLALNRALTHPPESRALPDPLPELPEVPISYLSQIKERIAAAGTLSSEAQASILVDLRPKLSGEDAKEARALLEQLRDRPDTLRTVGDQIDGALNDSRITKPKQPRQPRPPPPPRTPSQQQVQQHRQQHLPEGKQETPTWVQWTIGFFVLAVLAGMCGY